MEQFSTIGVIGIGKVGAAYAITCHQLGYSLGAIYNRTKGTANELADQIPTQVVDSPAEVVTQCDLIFITVADHAIDLILDQLEDVAVKGKGFVHASGALSQLALQPLADRGAHVGSLHPALPFADVEKAVRELPGTTLTMEASSDEMAEWLTSFADALGCPIISLTPEQKIVYHGILCFMSNYSVTLYATAQRLLHDLGADEYATTNALKGIYQATAANILKKGIPDALTGPLVRAEVNTIEKHLVAFQAEPSLEAAYRSLGLLTFPMLEARGTPTHELEEILKEKETICD